MNDNERRWAELKAANPGRAEQLLGNLRDLSQGRRIWAELLQVQDAELLGMAKLAAAKMELGLAADAERGFRALTQLDPFVPWFWMACGDALARLDRIQESIDAYGRCIDESSRTQPPAHGEIRAASLRRGRMLVRARQPQAAFEDFKIVLDLDTPGISDGEQARLAIEALVANGEIPEQVLSGLPVPR